MATTEPRIFNRPRPKKSLHPPPSKKRKTDHKIEEISFDFDARADYLTGFHKRKVQRATRAKAEAEKKAREERIGLRKQVCSSLRK
jgi:ribosomal RNA-processing protein 17